MTNSKNTSKLDHKHSSQLIKEDASCASFVNKIETALNAVPGVQEAQMNLALHTATVTGSANTESLISAIQQIGYKASSLDDNSFLSTKETPYAHRIDCEFFLAPHVTPCINDLFLGRLHQPLVC